jgi:protein-S-isoprenylcysteine O-methyltransferase Ste14
VPGLVEMYRQKSPSRLPKAVLTLIHLGAVLGVAWLLLGGGVARASAWLGSAGDVGPPLRRALLFGAAAAYFLRTLLTTFVFLKRRLGWPEAVAIGIWVGALQLLFAFLGGRQTEPVGIGEGVGALLYLAGSYLNTGSEYQRHVWKRQPQHQGQLYSGGLFRHAMHINYFGDLLLFTGWVLLTRRWVLLVVPVLMLLGFVFLNIPALDRYLAERYGADFRAYAARTKKLIPFLY